MSTRKRKDLSELDGFEFGGDGMFNHLYKDLPEVEPPRKLTRRERQDSKAQKVVDEHLNEHPQRKLSKDEWDARRAHLALKQSEEGDKQMRAIGEANLEDMQDLEQKMKKMKRKHGLGGTKKNKKNNKKKNKTKKGGKRSRRGGKKSRRRKKYKN
jgi:hypothetical protein